MTAHYFTKVTTILLVIAIGLLFAGCEDETPYSPPPEQEQREQPQKWPPGGEQSSQSDEGEAGWQDPAGFFAVLA